MIEIEKLDKVLDILSTNDLSTNDKECREQLKSYLLNELNIEEVISLQVIMYMGREYREDFPEWFEHSKDYTIPTYINTYNAYAKNKERKKQSIEVRVILGKSTSKLKDYFSKGWRLLQKEKTNEDTPF